MEKLRGKSLDYQIDKLGFVRLKSPGLGNCFFQSLETYFKISESEFGGLTHSELRTMIIDDLFAHRKNYMNYIEYENHNKNDYVQREIQKLYKDCVWSSDLADFIMYRVPSLFNVQLIIYNWNPGKYFNVIPLGSSDTKNTIHLLRVDDNHYDLLYPKDAMTDTSQNIWNALQQTRTRRRTVKKRRRYTRKKYASQ